MIRKLPKVCCYSVLTHCATVSLICTMVWSKDIMMSQLHPDTHAEYFCRPTFLAFYVAHLLWSWSVVVSRLAFVPKCLLVPVPLISWWTLLLLKISTSNMVLATVFINASMKTSFSLFLRLHIQVSLLKIPSQLHLLNQPHTEKCRIPFTP